MRLVAMPVVRGRPLMLGVGSEVSVDGDGFLVVVVLVPVTGLDQGDFLSSLATSSEVHSVGSLAFQKSWPKPYTRRQGATAAPAPASAIRWRRVNIMLLAFQRRVTPLNRHGTASLWD